MVTVGSDSHKRTHTLAAIDELGREVGILTVSATDQGHLEAVRWSSRWPERQWALEDCRQLSRRLESDLLAAGECVLRVPPKLMVGSRKSARTRGKSDPIDALAVARAALREPGLPKARLEGQIRELRLLVDHRDDLVQERTRIQNRLRWLLHELDPEFIVVGGTLDRKHVLKRVDCWLSDRVSVAGSIARSLVARTQELCLEIGRLERDLQKRVEALAPDLLTLVGCGPLGAAKLMAETAGVDRFRSSSCYARHNGSAPIPVWSGNEQRFRLNAGGNRQLNAALHRIAITQIRMHPPAIAYMAKRKARGNSRKEALRALKRHISDAVFRLLPRSETLPRHSVEHAA